MLLNGMFVDPESNIYDLVDSVRKEVFLIAASCKHVQDLRHWCEATKWAFMLADRHISKILLHLDHNA